MPETSKVDLAEARPANPTHVVTEFETFNKVLQVLGQLPFSQVAGLIQELNAATSIVEQTDEGFTDPASGAGDSA